MATLCAPMRPRWYVFVSCGSWVEGLGYVSSSMLRAAASSTASAQIQPTVYSWFGGPSMVGAGWLAALTVRLKCGFGLGVGGWLSLFHSFYYYHFLQIVLIGGEELFRVL